MCGSVPDKNATVRIVIVSLLTLLSSCAYSFSSGLPSHIKNVAVPLFANETNEFGIAEEVTDRLVSALVRDGTLRVVVDESEATTVEVCERPTDVGGRCALVAVEPDAGGEVDIQIAGETDLYRTMLRCYRNEDPRQIGGGFSGKPVDPVDSPVDLLLDGNQDSAQSFQLLRGSSLLGDKFLGGCGAFL